MACAAVEVLVEDNRKLQNVNDNLETMQSDIAIAGRVRQQVFYFGREFACVWMA